MADLPFRPLVADVVKLIFEWLGPFDLARLGQVNRASWRIVQEAELYVEMKKMQLEVSKRMWENRDLRKRIQQEFDLACESQYRLARWIYAHYNVYVTHITNCAHTLEMISFALSTRPVVDPEYVELYLDITADGSTECVEYLIERFPRLDLYADNGRGIKDAALYGNLPMVQWLWAHEPRFSTQLQDIFTASCWAQPDDTRLVEWLCSLEPAPNVRHNSDEAFGYAVKRYNRKIVRFLLAKEPRLRETFSRWIGWRSFLESL